MGWLVALAVLFLLAYSAGFRKAALGLVGVLIVVGTAVYVYEQIEDDRSRSRIPSSELEYLDIKLLNKSASSRQLTGRIKNNSKKYALRGLGLRIVLEDCEMLDKQTSCTVVAETTNNLSINVPPGQARDFSEGIYGLGSPIAKRNMVWRYEVTYIRGESY